jgi:G2/mitotic-specific cyclin 1/2
MLLALSSSLHRVYDPGLTLSRFFILTLHVFQARPARRVLTNENDENSNSTRLTRAKAAALNVDELAMPAKGALQTKRSAVNANPAAGRQRAALGDVSNVGKLGAAEGKKTIGGKPVSKGVGLVSKAAQPTGVQKNTSRAAPRSALTTKEPNKVQSKQAGPGGRAVPQGLKRRAPTTTASSREPSVTETEPARKKQQPEHVRAAPQPAAAPSVKVEASVEVEGPRDLEDDDLDDPLMVAEYANEIFEYLRELEVTSIPNPNYMEHQDTLEWKTRGILIDWLIEVHTRFHLLPETLFLAINIIDRFLSEKVVELDRLQLVGITAMFIASKYEEVLSPHVENFKRIADDGFSEAEILSAERFVLSTLSYDLSYPNPMNFLRRVSKADNYDIQSRTIGKYLMEISLLDHRFMEFRPSHVAAGAMYLARMMLDRGEWVSPRRSSGSSCNH